jgi:hypothetical protein
MRDAYAPLAWQCRYTGIEVPDLLWQYQEFGNHKKYSENQAEDMVHESKLMQSFENWVCAFTQFVTQKGKVRAGQYRAYAYKAPCHKIADMKLFWRSFRMSIGQPPKGSSPELQQIKGLNQNATLRPKKSSVDQVGLN